MKKILSVLFLLLTFASAASAQDSAYVRSIVRELTSERMQGRGTSYHGDSVAAAFLADEMHRLGVLPLAVNYLQHYFCNTYSNEGPLSLRINGAELEPYTQYRIGRAALMDRVKEVSFRRQLKDGTWVLGVPRLDTYGPVAGEAMENPVFIEVLDSLLPKKVRKIEAEIPLQYRKDYRSQNVVGYVRGVVDTMIVFTAHYDHCGIMGDGVVFPGAHDNASGVAAVLDIARMACKHKPYYTVAFMLFSGEETGLLGSRYAAEHPLVDFSKVKLLCNLDMFCGGDEGLMVFNAKSDETKPFFEKLKSRNEALQAAAEVRPRDNAPNSDHYFFSSLCPSIFLLTMGHPYGGYHDLADTCEACGLGHYNAFMQLILSLLERD